jgi:hypothetical protein
VPESDVEMARIRELPHLLAVRLGPLTSEGAGGLEHGELGSGRKRLKKVESLAFFCGRDVTGGNAGECADKRGIAYAIDQKFNELVE